MCTPQYRLKTHTHKNTPNVLPKSVALRGCHPVGQLGTTTYWLQHIRTHTAEVSTIDSLAGSALIRWRFSDRSSVRSLHHGRSRWILPSSDGQAAYYLISRQTTRPLDEKQGSKDWKRLRGELCNAARSAGVDFEKALLYQGNIPAAVDYTDDLVLDDTEAGAPASTLYHARQRALLAWLVNALPAESESAKLIKDCEHAGGRLGPRVGPAGSPQVLILLDTRWMDAAPEEGLGDMRR